RVCAFDLNTGPIRGYRYAIADKLYLYNFYLLIFIVIDEFCVRNDTTRDWKSFRPRRLSSPNGTDDKVPTGVQDFAFHLPRLRFPSPAGALAASRLAIAMLEVNRICMRVSPALLR
ncbi:hypothetical protein ALC53_01647, partial [Atta colombica]